MRRDWATGAGGVLDESKVAMGGGSQSYTGATVELQRFAGAVVTRIMHPPEQRIGAHSHDWPVLAVHCIGAYRERSEEGAAKLDGPSVVFHPAGAAHEDEIGGVGLETLSMSFDPAWLGPDARSALPKQSTLRVGGHAALAAKALAQAWVSRAGTEVACREALSDFLQRVLAHAAPEANRPPWLNAVATLLDAGHTDTQTLASMQRLHPAWLARAYRAWRGEGLSETLRRRRVEHAVLLLRKTSAPLAEIAVEAGFCDQSHMNRCFRAVLARTPAEVRREAALLAAVA